MYKRGFLHSNKLVLHPLLRHHEGWPCEPFFGACIDSVTPLYSRQVYKQRGKRGCETPEGVDYLLSIYYTLSICGSHSGLSTFFFPKETALKQIFCDHTIVS